MKRLALAMLVAFAGTSVAQTSSAPAPEPAPKARPPLKLNLDEIEPARPRVTFDARDEKKKDDPSTNLPGLGGRPSDAWVEPAKPVYPQNTDKAEFGH